MSDENTSTPGEPDPSGWPSRKKFESAEDEGPPGSGFPPRWPRKLADAAEQFLSEAGGLQGAQSKLDELEVSPAGGTSVADDGPGGSGFPPRPPRAPAAAAELFLSEAGGLQGAQGKLGELKEFRARGSS